MSDHIHSSKFTGQPEPGTAKTSHPGAVSAPKTGGHIAVRELQGVIAELRYSEGGGKSLPRHFHEEYQIILSEHRLIEYHYRRGFRKSPLGTLFVIHRGEAHSAEVLANTVPGAPLRTFLMSESAFASLTSEARPSSFPRLSSPIINGSGPFHRFVRLHHALFSGDDPLAAGWLLFQAVDNLVARSVAIGSGRSRTITDLRRAPSAPDRVRRVREYLATHWSERVDLAQLSAVAGLSPFHLLRLFRRQFGLPPHAYQTQLRLQRAKRLLLSGGSLADVALTTGFADQAHFTRVFNRFVGVPPGRYRLAR